MKATKSKARGNCYVTSEAVFHLTGGSAGPWRPEYVKHCGDTHWYLRNIATREVLDLTVAQFVAMGAPMPDYTKGVRCGFLTKQPSKRAAAMIEAMIWQTARQ